MPTCNEPCECGEPCLRLPEDFVHAHSCRGAAGAHHQGTRFRNLWGCLACDWQGPEADVMLNVACPRCKGKAEQITGEGVRADPSGKLSYADGKDMTEEEFLAAYKARDYPRPSVTVDLVIFTVIDTDLKVLLIRRGGHPHKGKLALPGGFINVGQASQHDQGEDLYTAAFRELGEETGLDQSLLRRHHVHLEQLYTFGCAYRDPRTRVIGVAYLALVPPDLVPLVVAGDDAAEAGFKSVYNDVNFTDLAFDHARILSVAVDRIQGKIDYAPIAFGLVPATFTTSELREVYEAVKGQHYDAANFRRRFKRMIEDGTITLAPGKRSSGDKGGRPAKVYTFDKHLDDNPNARPWPEMPLKPLPT